MNPSSPYRPVQLEDDFTFKACATELFRWVRAAGDVITEAPTLIREATDDLRQAWIDSAKR